MVANAMRFLIGAAVVCAMAGGCRKAQSVAGAAQRESDSTAAASSPQAAAFRDWQNKYPGTAALLQSVTGVRILLLSNRHPITGDQAKSLIKTLEPIPTMATLPQEQARKIAADVGGNLTPDQQTDIGLLRGSARARRGGSRPGTGARARGGGPNGPGQGAGMQWINHEMAPDENIFASGAPQRMLKSEIAQLKAAAQG